jgi:hypothetical protein
MDRSGCGGGDRIGPTGRWNESRIEQSALALVVVADEGRAHPAAPGGLVLVTAMFFLGWTCRIRSSRDDTASVWVDKRLLST